MKSSGVIASVPSRPPDSRVSGSARGRLWGTGDLVARSSTRMSRDRCAITRGA
jgi:hypothetical protein